MFQKQTAQSAPHPSAKVVKICDELRDRVARLNLMSGRMPEDEEDIALITRSIERVSRRHRVALGFAPVIELRAYPPAFSADCLSPAERDIATRNARQRGQGGSHGPRAASDVGAARHWTGDDAA
ncbi:hypothetical protein N1030_01610 [Desulfovibrio mangrovi]|uniref:hypothetical protein n=1 Tax=Desulfovibrio mangrovi TaxID=2976983 RepID=UPI0022454550|nr:hypothetical protein [Desulfovibrio mangrovi]UZP67691.1 hypothetical protein N1030_01610 [Desulfovibrio mangrovi]